MKKSEIRKIIKEELIDTKKEYIVWGVPSGKSHEEVLYTKAKSMSSAKKVAMILMTKYNATKTRVQVLDLTTTLDFSKLLSKR